MSIDINKIPIINKMGKEKKDYGSNTVIGLGKGETPLINLSFAQREIEFGETVLYTDPEVATTRDILGKEWDRYHRIVNYYVSSKEMLEQCIEVLTRKKAFDEVPEEFDDLARHFHRMKATYDRGAKEYTNDDFYPLGIKNSISYCVCRDLEPPFDVYNSDRYLDGSDKYKVKAAGGKQTVFITKRHPYVESEEELKSKQVTLTPLEDGEFEVKVNSDYVGIVRRYAIVVSTRKPVAHYGMFAIASSSGSKIFVYACDFDTVNYRDDKVSKKLGVWGSAAVILAYGFTNQSLEAELVKAKDFFEKNCDGRCVILIKPTERFTEGIDWCDETKPKNKPEIEFD